MPEKTSTPVDFEALQAGMRIEPVLAPQAPQRTRAGEPMTVVLGGPEGVQDDDIVTLTLEDDSTAAMTVAEFRARFATEVTRSTDGTAGSFVVPEAITLDEGWDERGLKQTLLKLFQVERVAHHELTDTLWERLDEKAYKAWVRFTKEAALDFAAARLAWGICRMFEQSVLAYESGQDSDEREGMLELGSEPENPILRSVQPGEPLPMSDKGVLLVFIHGTASSTLGSFGALWQEHRETVDRLRGEYKHLYAWEHRTLTESPVDNALRLLRTLPDGVTLDIVSHSRGGLVGELLARGQMEQVDGGALPPFAAEVLEEFEKAGHPDAESLRELNDLLQAKAIKLRRFVRVACPARGTILASSRLDRFIGAFSSIFLKVLGLGSNPIALGLDQFVKQLVKARSDSSLLPGLAAQIPGSLLVRVLNDPTVATAADLHVIAGDVHGQMSLSLRSLKVYLSDLFYQEDHDFIVHTAAMSGGTGRLASAWRFLVRGATVSHFSYFRNGESVSKMLGALTGDDTGFERIERESEDVQRGDPLIENLCRTSPAKRLDKIRQEGARPIVLVLPGIMGSEISLAENGDPVWFSLGQMNRGGIRKLQLGDDEAVQVSGVLMSHYGRLMRHLDEHHHPVAVPYDWRQSMGAAAEGLQAVLEQALEIADEWQQPVHLIAHSMGGLVMRALLRKQAGQALWERVRASQGRLLMLGVPNRGSLAPAAVFITRDLMIGAIAFLDWQTSYRRAASIVAEFPGLLELMPRSDWAARSCSLGSLWDEHTWRALAAIDGRVAVPSQALLASAQALFDPQAFAAELKQLADDPNVLYVAGVAEATPCRLFETEAFPMAVGEGPFAPDASSSLAAEGKRLVFDYTTAGDGRVTWESGVLEPSRTWVVPVAHGDLPDAKFAFDAYVGLLQGGGTTSLTPFADFQTQRGEPIRLAGPKVELAQITRLSTLDSRQLQAAILAGVVPIARPRPEAAPLEVSLVHGNLEYMRFPVLFGQYLDERMSSAGIRIDEKLHGQFQLLLSTQLFRGDDGEMAFLGAARDPHYLAGPDAAGMGAGTWPDGDGLPDPCAAPGFGGAVAIGLGRWGELTSEKLAKAVQRAVLRMAVDRSHYTPDEAEQPLELRLSSLLIGSGKRSISVRESVSAILRGIKHAAEQLVDQGLDHKVRMAQLEFVELYEDSAHEAAHALNSLLRSPELKGWLRPTRNRRRFMVEPRSGGRRRLFWQPDSTIYQRIAVEAAGADLPIRLRYVSDRARSDQFSLKVSAPLVAQLVEQAAHSGDPGIGATLYELLLPPSLKERFADFRDTELELDDAMAAVPWEILRDSIGPADGFTRTEPLSVRASLIRRRVRQHAGPPVRQARGNTALVIGDPDLQGSPGFSELPAAAREARGVDAVLREAGFVSRLLERTAASQLFTELLTSQYSILHIAAHGTLSPTPGEAGRSRAGVVLGHGMVFSADDVAAIRRVPELVFINCCHLGRDAPASGALQDEGTPALQPIAGGSMQARFAANVGTSFVDIGAKAVVVAGWAVNDREAADFARKFYEQMLAGETFAHAVREARALIYHANPAGTTWGAYQCYGNPDFRLRLHGPSSTRPQLASARELAQEIHNRAANVTAGIVRRYADQVDVALEEGRDMGWSDAPEVLVAHGSFLARAGYTDEALEKLGRVLRDAPHYLGLGTLEIYANLLVRSVQRKPQQPGRKEAETAIQGARQLIQGVVDARSTIPGAGGPETSPVLDLLQGSIMLRAAQVWRRLGDRDRQREELASALEHYLRGFQLLSHKRLVSKRTRLHWMPATGPAVPAIAFHGRREADQAWALAAGLLAGLCLRELPAGKVAAKSAPAPSRPPRAGAGRGIDLGRELASPARLAALLACLDAEAERLMDALQDADFVSLNFWDRSALAELHLVRAAYRPETLVGQSDSDPKTMRAALALKNRYLDAISCGPNLYEVDSLRHRFDLVIAAYSEPSAHRLADAFRGKIEQIYADLEDALSGRAES